MADEKTSDFISRCLERISSTECNIIVDILLTLYNIIGRVLAYG